MRRNPAVTVAAIKQTDKHFACGSAARRCRVASPYGNHRHTCSALADRYKKVKTNKQTANENPNRDNNNTVRAHTGRRLHRRASRDRASAQTPVVPCRQNRRRPLIHHRRWDGRGPMHRGTPCPTRTDRYPCPGGRPSTHLQTHRHTHLSIHMADRARVPQ